MPSHLRAVLDTNVNEDLTICQPLEFLTDCRTV
jgi:hypothetical protein